VAFHISNRTALTQGAIYLTEEFAQHGEHFGGPPLYRGGAILFDIWDGRISFEYRDNNGDIDFTNHSLMPNLAVALDSDTFELTLELSSFRMLRITANIRGQESRIFYGKERIEITKTWFSVVAFCPFASLELTIQSVNLSFADQPPALATVFTTTPIGVSEFDPASGLVHRELQRLSRVLLLSRQNVDADVGGSTETIFEAILEIDRVLNASATVGPVKKVIAAVTANFTDAWRRRALRMESESEILRMRLSGEVEALDFIVKAFRWNVEQTMSEIREKLKETTPDIAELYFRGIKEEVRDALPSIPNDTPVRVLIIAGLVEITALFGWVARLRFRGQL
jgi:hypothetical protein